MRNAILVLAVLAANISAAGPRFEVSLDPKLPKPKESGRLILALAKTGTPRFTNTSPPGQPLLAIDAAKFPAVIDGSAMTFPLTSLDKIPAGEYTAQVVFATNRDIDLPNAPGNLTSNAVKIQFDPKADATHKLELVRAIEETVPADSPSVKYLKLPSKLLSEFHGRPMDYRLSVVLPPNFEKDADKKYALIVYIGGFGSRYTFGRMRPDPRFVQIMLDGAGPFGDPYQVNSANNGPYGDALVTEVIPHVEKTFRCLGTPASRFTTGGSTGGWVSLALQIFYPDIFNGCWSQCPDGIDFRAFELIDIYTDKNAYVNRYGFERPAKRTIDGDTIYTVRHENQIERVLGRGGRWELSGRDWGSWNAAYGPRGADGLPVPLWDGESGVINKDVLKHWEKYDLRKVLVKDWKTLQPKLKDKINIWVGDADDYFLNNAVHRFQQATQSLSPAFEGTIQIEIRRPHTSGGWTRAQMLDAMAARAAAR